MKHLWDVHCRMPGMKKDCHYHFSAWQHNNWCGHVNKRLDPLLRQRDFLISTHSSNLTLGISNKWMIQKMSSTGKKFHYHDNLSGEVQDQLAILVIIFTRKIMCSLAWYWHKCTDIQDNNIKKKKRRVFNVLVFLFN